MWAMVGKFASTWKSNGWYRASLKNHSEFKNLIIQHILFSRKKIDTNLIPKKFLDTIKDEGSLQQTYMFYSKEEFLVQAENKYKENLGSLYLIRHLGNLKGVLKKMLGEGEEMTEKAY